MKKKLLSTLLCVAMALGTLAGCGAKETTSDNVVVETEEHVENETTTNEEVEVENETNDIVVDAERPELAEVGKTTYMDWGSYTIVDSANGLDDVEVEFYEMTFKATVPQDMGATSDWNEKSLLRLYNEDKSKVLSAWYFNTSIENKEIDNNVTKEEFQSLLSNSSYEDDYYFNKEWVNDNLLKITFEANTTLSNGVKTHGYAVFICNYELGLCYQFYYGEDVNICDMEVVKLVANSFDFLAAEELAAHSNGVVDLESTGNMSSEYLTSYGLVEGALIFPNDTNIVENDNMLTTNTNGVTLEKANEIVNTFVNTMEVYDMSGTQIIDSVDVSSYWEGYYKSGDNWNQIAVMFSSAGDTGNFSVCIRKNYPINF